MTHPAHFPEHLIEAAADEISDGRLYRDSYYGWCVSSGETPESIARAALTAAHGAAIIRTVEELDALSVGSVVHFPHANNAAVKDTHGWWAVGGFPDPWTAESVAAGLHRGYAVVLHYGATEAAS